MPASDTKTACSRSNAMPPQGRPVAEAVGLTSKHAKHLLTSIGPNSIVDVAQHPLLRAFQKLWAPVPWMLEAAIALQLVLGDYDEATLVALLLFANAALGDFQESRALATLNALQSRLALSASPRRDGAWKTLPAAKLMPGDVVKLSLGPSLRPMSMCFPDRSCPTSPC